MDELENIMLGERSYHKMLHVSFHLYEMSKIAKSMQTESRLVVA